MINLFAAALALTLTAGNPVAVPGPVCAATDNLALSVPADRFRIGEDAYFKPICDGFRGNADVLFAFNSARLRPQAQPILQALAAELAVDTMAYTIDGHTDWIGSVGYNQKLSQKRAEAVRLALIKLGIAESRLTARGFGELRPVAENRTAQGRQLNRRVEVLKVAPQP